jgi:aspartyl-tRNA synthetase
LRDSYGTTQLVVHTPVGDPSLDGDVQQSNHVTDLARIPVESTVLIQGHVRLRPEKQRRPVITHLIPLGSQTNRFPDRPPFLGPLW